MEYTVNRLAQISGVSKRTLRYYDEIGLLRPERVNPNGYRIYGQMQVDLLQQILFYRELGLPLEEIRDLTGKRLWRTILQSFCRKKDRQRSSYQMSGRLWNL